MQRCAVFCCRGMGDGIISLVLSNNLQLNGGTVTTFHPFLESFQPLFPDLPILKFPPLEDLEESLSQFDQFFIFFERSAPVLGVLNYCLRVYPDKTTVLNPIATPRNDYPYWEGGRFDGNRPFLDNLYAFCKDILGLRVVTKANGIALPEHIRLRHFKNRVVIHPSSSREGKNWPKQKYLQLCKHLQKKGFIPSLILTEEEKKGWDENLWIAPLFSNPVEMASYVAQSGYMIGNDSGIGHLASCLGLPTLTICRHKQASKFWRPSWARGVVVTPPPWIPNIRGFRLRDQYWKKLISVDKVLERFEKLL